MNQKASERPTLQGQRIKTRKRDEKEKFDPQGFGDSILQGFKESEGDLEQLSKFLDVAGSKLDYRRYSESLFDILIAGGLLAPGGTLMNEGQGERATYYTELSVFGRPSDDESVRAFTQVFVRLIRRYKYLEKALEEVLNKIVVFLRAFTPENRLKLAKLFAHLLASGHISVSALKTLLEQDLPVKEGLAFQFLLDCLRTWQAEKDAATVWSALRKSGLDTKLLDFLPKSKRNQEYFSQHFLEAGLGQLLEYQRTQRVETLKKELSTEVTNQINEGVNAKELINVVKEYMIEYSLSEHEVVVILWNTLMSMMEWNKKEELVADQAVKHLRTYLPLLEAFAKSSKAEMALLIRVQDFCYENMNFLKAFQKIVLLFYKNDIISEDVILRWYKKDHSPKGKSIFLEQMKKFIEWLITAEEEGSDEE